jgi:hypothetical protein
MLVQVLEILQHFLVPVIPYIKVDMRVQGLRIGLLTATLALFLLSAHIVMISP